MAEIASYDFFVLQSTTAGGQALNEFLRDHPGLFLPPREVVDGLFVAGQESALLSDAPPHVIAPTWPNTYINGFMLHDSMLLQEDVPGRVSKLQKAGSIFLQLVRDPIEALVAQYQRYADHAGLRALSERLGIQAAGYEMSLGNPDPRSALSRMLGSTGRRLFYFSEGERYFSSHPYGSWELIDARELMPDVVDHTMSGIAKTLGVEQHHTGFYQKNFHGTLQKLLGIPFSVFPINAFGHDLVVALELKANLPYLSHELNFELCSTKCLVQLPRKAASEIEVSMVVSPSAWRGLPKKLRTHLQSGVINDLFEGEILPAWLERVDYVREESTKRVAHGHVPESLIRELRDLIGHDCDKLAQRWPKIERLWPTWFV